MSEANAFKDLIGRVRAGDEAAAAQLVQMYEPAIRLAARVRLADTRLQRLFDSMDISQSVFGSFFVRAALGQYELEKPEQLMRLLVAMSRKKLADHARQEGAARRDYRRTRGDSQQTKRLVAPDANPGTEVTTKELLQEFRKRLSPQERQLADRRSQGLGWDHIAAEVGGTPEALRKQLSRAIDRISQELGFDEFRHE